MIENLKPSIFDSDVKFVAAYLSPHKVMVERRNNFDITDMHWITLKPSWDGYELYNPKALILLHLN